MEDFEGIDLTEYKNQRNQLTKLSVDKYWNQFKGDWKSYMSEVFKWDDIPKEYVKPVYVPKKEIHPFETWIN